MKHAHRTELQQLPDEALIERLSSSVRDERQGTVAVLVEMGEVLAREVYRELGYSSMFVFATRRLGMSEAEAAIRIRAARLGRAIPEALELLALGEVNLTTLSLLAPIVTQDSRQLLYDARFLSKHEVLELIARHSPRQDTPDVVRRVPSARPSARAPAKQGAPEAATTSLLSLAPPPP